MSPASGKDVARSAKEQKTMDANRKEFSRAVIHSMPKLLAMFRTDNADKTSYLLRIIQTLDMELISLPDFRVSVEKMVDNLKELLHRGKPELLTDTSLAFSLLVDSPGAVCQVSHRTLLIMIDSLHSSQDSKYTVYETACCQFFRFPKK